MTKDQNKNITQIKYNHLNLPIEIRFASNRRTIRYIYDANGVKMKKVAVSISEANVTVYSDGFQYTKKNDEPLKLQFFPTAEGYVQAVYNGTNPQSKFQYVYNYTDHLGNIRLQYAKVSGQLKIMEEDNYYPFGLKHHKYNVSKNDVVISSNTLNINTIPTPERAYKYKYQGQERQNDFGLNWDSFKWRNYDYAIGRFMSIDPLAEKYTYNSTYAFSENRVVDGRELEGLEVVSVGKETTFSIGISGAWGAGIAWSYYDGFYSYSSGALGIEGNASISSQVSITVFPNMMSIKDFEGGGKSFGAAVSLTVAGVGIPMGGSVNYVESDGGDVGINVTFGFSESVLPFSLAGYKTDTKVYPLTNNSKKLYKNSVINKGINLLENVNTDISNKIDNLKNKNFSLQQTNTAYKKVSSLGILNKEDNSIYNSLIEKNKSIIEKNNIKIRELNVKKEIVGQSIDALEKIKNAKK